MTQQMTAGTLDFGALRRAIEGRDAEDARTAYRAEQPTDGTTVPSRLTADPRQQRQLYNVTSSGEGPQNDATVATNPIGDLVRVSKRLRSDAQVS